ILLCFATKKGYEALLECRQQSDEHFFYVCTFKEVYVEESYDQTIREHALSAGMPIVTWKEFQSDPVSFLTLRQIRAIVCIGWRYLIPDAAIRHLGGEVIIAHDSLLPRLRGFAPLPTALIIGEKETGVTFLRVGKGVDDGDILWQRRITIDPHDTIARL